MEGKALVEARLGEVLEVTHGDRQLVLELLGLGVWDWVWVGVGVGGGRGRGRGRRVGLGVRLRRWVLEP